MTEAFEAQAKLHVITYLDWHQEGTATADANRAQLLDTLATLVEHLTSAAEREHAQQLNILLSTQTLILDQVIGLRPDLVTALVRWNKAAQLQIGPWYVTVDGLLASGEVFVRTLLLGLSDRDRYGLTLATVAPLLNSQQQPAQLPQILHDFGIDSVFLGLNVAEMALPFVWEAQDGSQVLALLNQTTLQAATTIAKQQEAQPDGPFLWMVTTAAPHASDMSDVDLGHNTLIAEQTSLAAYATATRAALPDMFRPVIAGDVYLGHDATLSGRFSARRDLKQAYLLREAMLSHHVEPLLALALTHGQLAHPENLTNLLEYVWRLLLQNQAWRTAIGAIHDDVSAEVQLRNRRIGENCHYIVKRSLAALPGHYKPAAPEVTPSDILLVVWNLQGHPVEQVVTEMVELPEERYPSTLIGPDGAELPFYWEDDVGCIGFLAEVPAVGYAVYRLTLSKNPTAIYNQKQVVETRTISNAVGDTLAFHHSGLEWRFNGQDLAGLLRYYDSGDAGDVWRYRQPVPDLVVQARFVDAPRVETTPVYERLFFRNRMRIAPQLKDGIGRYRGLRVLDLATEATYYETLNQLHFRVEFDNSAEDHRLRAVIRTGIQATHLYVDTAHGLSHRPMSAPSGGLQPMQRFVALFNGDETEGVGLFTRGLLEFEPLVENGQVTLALTLLRAVGWLDEEHMHQARAAQLLGHSTVEFMLMRLNTYNPAQLLRTAEAYHAPIQVYQYAEPPASFRRSFLQVASDQIILTALKPPQTGHGWIVRLLNPTNEHVSTHLIVDGALRRVVRVTMAEIEVEDVAIAGEKINISLGPHQVMTLRLEFVQPQSQAL